MKNPNNLILYIITALAVFCTYMFITTLSLEHEPYYYWLLLQIILVIAAMAYASRFEVYRKRLRKGWWIIALWLVICGVQFIWFFLSSR